jgi:TonB family protein
MFKILVTIALLIGILVARGQTCVVRSFRWEDPRDVKGMPKPEADLAGKKCAVFKVETWQKDYTFDFGITGNAVTTLQKDSALWLWVPAGATNVTITNKSLKVNCVYPLGTELEEKVNYVMVLSADKPGNNIKGVVETKWVNLQSNPPKGANIYIDDFPAGKTPFYGSLTMGSHKVKMEKNKVVMEQTLTVSPQEEVKLNMTFESELKAFQKENEGVLIHYEEETEYPGGYEAFQKFLRENVKYPALAVQNKIEGTVFVQFVITITGKVSNVRILRGIGGGCDEEAVRVVKLMPNWTLNRFWGAVMPCIYQFPVKFQLQKKD